MNFFTHSHVCRGNFLLEKGKKKIDLLRSSDFKCSYIFITGFQRVEVYVGSQYEEYSPSW